MNEIKKSVGELKKQITKLMVPINQMYLHQPQKRCLAEKLEEYLYDIQLSVESMKDAINDYDKKIMQ